MAFTKITHAGIGSTGTVLLENLEVTGVGTFGGSVSVGGTLTYEDVTNIDSVGLITARNGIVVGSGITLSKDGDGFFTGIVTATSFAGDGSALTGITQTTINNNAANRIITGSGTANTLNGNSDLLWNGSRLDIDTGGTEDALRIGNTAGTDTFIRLGSIGTSADTHAVIKYDKDDNYLSLLVSGESHGSGGVLVANGGAVSLSGGTSPLAKLHVKDDIYVKGSSGDGSTGIQIRSGSSAISNQHQVRTGGGTGNMLILEAVGASGIFQVQTAGSERVRISSAGKMGVGTNNPTSQVDIHCGSDNTGLQITSTDAGAFASYFDNTGASTIGHSGTNLVLSCDPAGSVSSSNIVFQVDSNSEKARIDSSGRMGLGTILQSDVGSAGAGLKIETYLQRNTIYAFPDGYYAASLGEVNNTQTKVWASVDSHYSQSSAASAGLFLSAFHADAGGSGCGAAIKNLKSGNALTFSSVTTASSVGNPAVETERLRIDSSGRLLLGTTTSNASSGSLHVKNAYIRLQAANQNSGDFSQEVGIEWSQEEGSDVQVGKIVMRRDAWGGAPHNMDFYSRTYSNQVTKNMTIAHDGGIFFQNLFHLS